MGMLLRHRPNENPQAVAPKKAEPKKTKEVKNESTEEKPVRGRKRKPE